MKPLHDVCHANIEWYVSVPYPIVPTAKVMDILKDRIVMIDNIKYMPVNAQLELIHGAKRRLSCIKDISSTRVVSVVQSLPYQVPFVEMTLSGSNVNEWKDTNVLQQCTAVKCNFSRIRQEDRSAALALLNKHKTNIKSYRMASAPPKEFYDLDLQPEYYIEYQPVENHEVFLSWLQKNGTRIKRMKIVPGSLSPDAILKIFRTATKNGGDHGPRARPKIWFMPWNPLR